jgi:hypothetical protein
MMPTLLAAYKHARLTDKKENVTEANDLQPCSFDYFTGIALRDEEVDEAAPASKPAWPSEDVQLLSCNNNSSNGKNN